MSDTAVEAARKWKEQYLNRSEYEWTIAPLVQMLDAHTANLTARLASADTLRVQLSEDSQRHLNQFSTMRAERDTLKAAVEQAHALMERAADSLDNIAQFSISGQVYNSLRSDLRAALTSTAGGHQ